MNFIAYFEVEGKKISDCTRAYFEIADVWKIKTERLKIAQKAKT